MKKLLAKLFASEQKPSSLREAINQTKIDTDPKHLINFQDAFVENLSKTDVIFKDVTDKKIVKVLGLVHNPQVRTVESTATFNQRAAAVHRQMKKGLKKKNKVVLQEAS